jgi:hypothetical protein
MTLWFVGLDAYICYVCIYCSMFVCVWCVYHMFLFFCVSFGGSFRFFIGSSVYRLAHNLFPKNRCIHSSKHVNQSEPVSIIDSTWNFIHPPNDVLRSINHAARR